VRAGEIIERQVKVMARRIDDLMDVARINQGRLELRLHEVDLHRAIDLALEASRPQIEDAGHTLSVTMPDEPIPVRADVTRLAQVLTNVLTNASKYTNRGGAVELAVHVTPGSVQITIRDNGIGIAPDNLARVFDMFSQVEVALARSRGGLGIGLSLARRLVQLHGGSIEATSPGLGKGSAFTIRLPTLHAEVVVPARVRKPLVAARNTARNVLVVDDNQDGAETLALLLGIHGFNVTMASDGEAALKAAQAGRPDIILLDIGLPKMNGYEVCKAIRAESWARDTIIIAITGWGDPAAKASAVEAGFDHHFVKPVMEEQLIDMIDTLSERQSR